MRYLYICLAIYTLVFENIYSLNTTEYIAFIEELSQDEQFLEDYAKWSLELFSQPDHLYGRSPGPFPCPIPTKDVNVIPTSVHKLRPSDIKCVAALGDSLTAGLGAHAITPIGLMFENRGVSWSIGGDYTFNRSLSLPNILRQYNNLLKGYSTKTSVIFLNGQNASHNNLNVAKSGALSYDTIEQAKILLERINSSKDCDLENDWKLITIFIGGNDLCVFCKDLDKHSPENFTKHVNETLYFLQNNIPHALVNLVLVFDIRNVELLNAGGPICRLFHRKTCSCAAFPTEDDATILEDWVPKYHQKLIDLINTGLYNQKDDFTVVIQPFMAHAALRRKLDGSIDFTYFAPDCFHFSGKGHQEAAYGLWNNMLEPVGNKSWTWPESYHPFKCPTEEQPYIFTSKNSPKQFETIPPIKANK